MTSPAVEIVDLEYRYGQRQALDRLSLSVPRGEIFAMLGPNGSGKTTLFRLLATLLPVERGSIRLLDQDLRGPLTAVRRQLGVVFQSPSLDKKLTVAENLRCGGQLYGLHGARLTSRIESLLATFGLADRQRDRVETLSGGLRRRAELAKALLHSPSVLLLDEPSTGLDPAARRDLWQHLVRLRAEDGVTVLLTTHLLDEAERADRLAILDQGRLVALDSPQQLRATLRGETITIVCPDPGRAVSTLREQLGLAASVLDEAVRLELPDAHQWLARLVEALPGQVQSITLQQPSLEDVFIARTGRSFQEKPQAA